MRVWTQWCVSSWLKVCLDIDRWGVFASDIFIKQRVVMKTEVLFIRKSVWGCLWSKRSTFSGQLRSWKHAVSDDVRPNSPAQSGNKYSGHERWNLASMQAHRCCRVKISSPKFKFYLTTLGKSQKLFCPHKDNLLKIFFIILRGIQLHQTTAMASHTYTHTTLKSDAELQEGLGLGVADS